LDGKREVSLNSIGFSDGDGKGDRWTNTSTNTQSIWHQSGLEDILADKEHRIQDYSVSFTMKTLGKLSGKFQPL
jgi:hypothetical protein